MAEATNFAVPEWIPYGLSSRVCLCRHDSVRIDMNRFRNQLDLYEKDQRRAADMSCKKWMSWRDWSLLQTKRKRQPKEQLPAAEQATSGGISNESSGVTAETGEIVQGFAPLEQPPVTKPTKRRRTTKLSDQQRKREFWVEVMQPLSAERKGSVSQFRKRSKPIDGSNKEVWHLAKPVLRKMLKVQSKVLCIVPVAKAELDDEDEECFRGTITEISQDHVRVHFDGLQRKEDIWIPMSSAKLFIDGGRWTEEEEMPVLHFWQEEDSKKRCL